MHSNEWYRQVLCENSFTSLVELSLRRVGKDRKIGFVVEGKDVKDETKLDAACEAAMKQIKERDYTAVLRRYRVKEIWTYGIAFWEKECRVVARKVG